MQLPVAREQQRRHDRVQQAAERAAGRDREVVAREAGRLRAPARELAVARHRVDEEDRAPQHDARGDLHQQLAVQAEHREARGHGQRDPPRGPTRVRPAEATG